MGSDLKPRGLNAARLASWPFRDVNCRYGETEAILYALSIGLGADPLDEGQLRYVFEKALKAFPTLALVLRDISEMSSFLEDPEVGIDMRRMLHAETALRIHKPIPPAGEIVSRTAIDRLVDRGEAKGAVLYYSRTLRQAGSGELLASETGSFFLRGNGGFGGPPGPMNKPAPVPERGSDLQCELAVLPQAALLYRLTGDRNPLHADPGLARAAGFERPLLHGLCTFGHAAHGLVRLLCGYDGDRVRRLEMRFTAVVLPGDTLRLEVWRTGPGEAAFRVHVPSRGVVAIDNGVFEFAEGP